MSIDRYFMVETKQVIRDISDLEAWELIRSHTVWQMANGVEHLYIFDNAEEATAAFERWRREPCERISLTVNGVEQPGDRLPLACKVCREEIPVNQPNLFEGEVYCDPCLDKESAQRMEHDQL